MKHFTCPGCGGEAQFSGDLNADAFSWYQHRPGCRLDPGGQLTKEDRLESLRCNLPAVEGAHGRNLAWRTLRAALAEIERLHALIETFDAAWDWLEEALGEGGRWPRTADGLRLACESLAKRITALADYATGKPSDMDLGLYDQVGGSFGHLLEEVRRLVRERQPSRDDRTPEESSVNLHAAIRSALLRVARNVAKHTIQRAGFTPEDECFQVDLTAAEQEIGSVVSHSLTAFRRRLEEERRFKHWDQQTGEYTFSRVLKWLEEALEQKGVHA